MTKLISNNLETEVNTIAREINALVDKYASEKNISILGEPSGKDQGFYLLFIKRDEKLGENRLEITTFGKYMSGIDITNAMESALSQLIPLEEKQENLA